MILPDKIEFNLTKKIVYAHKGEKKDGWTLDVMCPSNNVAKFIRPLKQGFTQALMQNALNAKSSESKKISTESDDGTFQMEPGMLMILLYSSNLDMVQYTDYFKSLLLEKGVCLVDGVEQLQIDLYNQLSTDDTDNLLGRYINDFLLSSWNLNSIKK